MGWKRWRGGAKEKYDPALSERRRRLEGAPLASFRRRAAGFLLDLFIGAVPLSILFGFFIVYASRHGWLEEGKPLLRFFEHEHMVEVTGKGSDRNVIFDVGFLNNLVGLVWWVLYFGLSLYWGKGKTLGKRLVGIRVVSLDHERLSLWHCIERALAYGASALEAGFGFFQYFLDKNRRTVHDRIAETIVVREERTKPAAEKATQEESPARPEENGSSAAHPPDREPV